MLILAKLAKSTVATPCPPAKNQAQKQKHKKKEICYILMENLTCPPRQLLPVKDAVGPLFMIDAAVWFFPSVLVSDYSAN